MTDLVAFCRSSNSLARELGPVFGNYLDSIILHKDGRSEASPGGADRCFKGLCCIDSPFARPFFAHKHPSPGYDTKYLQNWGIQFESSSPGCPSTACWGIGGFGPWFHA